MDFKTSTLVCFFALSVVHLALAKPAENGSYPCMQPFECTGNAYAIYVVAGNETLCCDEGDAILFSARSKNYYFAQGGFVHYRNESEAKNDTDTRVKRSVDEAASNTTIKYECVCSPVDKDEYMDVKGNFAVVMRYLRVQLDKTRSLVRSLVRTYVL